MKTIAMILRKPPYGDVNAAEAVRHVLGAVSGDIAVSLILVDGGVQLARKGQDETDTGFTNLGVALEDCIEMGARVVADNLSLVEQGLGKEDIIEGVEPANESDIAVLLKQADNSMIF
jgi:tRNA 2-thiouridine synthesizing protein D